MKASNEEKHLIAAPIPEMLFFSLSACMQAWHQIEIKIVRILFLYKSTMKYRAEFTTFLSSMQWQDKYLTSSPICTAPREGGE